MKKLFFINYFIYIEGNIQINRKFNQKIDIKSINYQD